LGYKGIRFSPDAVVSRGKREMAETAEELRDQITEYMDNCPVCVVATASADGEPSAATVYHKRSGLDLYFNAAKDSRKVRNILANPRVAIVMQEDAPVPRSDLEIKGIQAAGTAEVLTDGEAAVPKAVLTRHNTFNRWKPGGAVMVKVTLSEVYLIDYSKGLRHREQLRP
jgi:nitroimidazol reductase NimA-like FMN-containing flavoprotein (pyridoxamine 5'-phosphate oxidase superfamily)